MASEAAIDAVIEDKKLRRWDGTKGVENLARLCNGIGYKDTQYFGQFAPDGSYGDLIEFLQDNPGAVEAVVNFIRENASAYDVPEPEEEDDEEE